LFAFGVLSLEDCLCLTAWLFASGVNLLEDWLIVVSGGGFAFGVNLKDLKVPRKAVLL
jgi:hypothetical protein